MHLGVEAVCRRRNSLLGRNSHGLSAAGLDALRLLSTLTWASTVVSVFAGPEIEKRPLKRVLALPDLDQSIAAVLNTLTSKSDQLTYDPQFSYLPKIT
jgi:hypothetical protein